MESVPVEALSRHVPDRYVEMGLQALSRRHAMVQRLIVERKLPETPWTDDMVVSFLNELAAMDANNFEGVIGVGEREGRVFSQLVARRSYGLIHGIGRSGDITAPQPKAAGSSVLHHLTLDLLHSLLVDCGIPTARRPILMPTATGLGLLMCLLTLKKTHKPHAKYVIWPRIDQKSCFKCITAAGLIPIVIELDKGISSGKDSLTVDPARIEEAIVKYGTGEVLCVISTTSCFSPRAPDPCDKIAAICHDHHLPYLINNAYGLQSTRCCHLVNEAMRIHPDSTLVVQSTDKNLMVPVGGCIITGGSDALVEKVAKTYAGRASGQALIDVFITLVQMGKDGYRNLVKDRKKKYEELKAELYKLADEFAERVLDTRDNTISLAMTLRTFDEAQMDGDTVSNLGAKIFRRNISGARVLSKKKATVFEGHEFTNFGMHTSDPQAVAYVNAAAALGMGDGDAVRFVHKLRKILKEEEKRLAKQTMKRA
eukprot:Clim_evm34s207 gene=Clim_evmTU34s207